MLRRTLAGLFVALLVGGVVLGEDTRGTVTKIEDDTITLRTGFGKDAKEKEFKVSKDTKIIRVLGKDKDDVKLTLSELKTAVKVTNVFLTVVHDGDTVTELKITPFGFGVRPGKDKKKDDKKDQ
jgi:hypothetical protein